MVTRVAIALLATLALPASAHAAGTWNPETFLAVGLTEASGPSIAIATTGAGVAGWQQEQGFPRQVDAMVHSRGAGTAAFTTGGTRQMVQSAKSHSEGDMGMTSAVNASGKAVVAWVQGAFNGKFRVQAVVRAAGASTFGPVQTLTLEGEDAAVPAVAMNASGAAVVVWRRHEAATKSWQVQGAVLTDAGTTFTPLNGGGNISSEPDDGFDSPVSPLVRVAIAPSGAAVVTWDGNESSMAGVARWARKGPTDIAFGSANGLGAATHFPDVAASDNGGFALTWIVGTGGTGATAWLARATTGGFGAPIPVGSTASAFTDSRVALDAAGTAYVAILGTMVPTLEAKRRVSTATCATACGTLDLLSADGQDASGMDIAVNAAGDAVLAWSRSNGTRELIEASLKRRGAAWDAPVFISRTDRAAHAPTVGIDGGGNVSAAWTMANVALFAVKQATGAVEGATAPPTGGGGGGGSGGGGGNNQPPTGGGGGGGGGGTVIPIPERDTTVDATVKQAKKLTATTTFSGPKITCAEACKATITFTTPGKTKKAKPVTVGTAKVTLAAGKSATPKVKLAKAAKALLAKKSLALTGKVVVTDNAGNRRAFTVKATLKKAKKR